MKKDDNVFQVSLTEIAFTLVFLMLLLLGTRLIGMVKEINSQKDLLAEQQAAIDQKDRELKTLRELSSLGGLCRPDPEDPIEPMMPCIKCVAVQSKISKDEASKTLELGTYLRELWRQSNDKETIDEFFKKVSLAAEKLSEGHALVTNDEQLKVLEEAEKALTQMAALRSDNEALKSDNSELLTQNNYFKRRVGMDDPPCWLAQNSYRPEYLFSVHINADGTYLVKPNWPESRAQEAMQIPGVKEMIERQVLSKSDFSRFGMMILKHAQSQKPQACRYFVTMQSDIPDRKTADLARLKLEEYFYKYEIVR